MKNKGFVLIASLFLSIFIGISLAVCMMRLQIQLRAIELRRASLYAFYAAEAGLENTISNLRRNGAWREGFKNKELIWSGGNKNEKVGIYNVSLADADSINTISTIWIRSEGQDALTNIKRVILARASVENPASFFISTMKNLYMGSGVNIQGKILGLDIYFEVQQGLPQAQRVININGRVEYVRNIAGQLSPDVTINDGISENNPDYYKRNPITFIGVDLDYYKELAKTAGIYINDAFNWSVDSGDIKLVNMGADPGNNGVIYVEGDIYISGLVTQSVIVVSGGSIYIDGNITCAGYVDEQNQNKQYQIGLLAHKDVIVPVTAPNDINIEALVVADGGVFKTIRPASGANKGAFNFKGVLAARGSDDTNIRTAIECNAYDIRNLVYNEALRTDPQIPYLNSIVNIIQWKEAGLSDSFPPA